MDPRRWMYLSMYLSPEEDREPWSTTDKVEARNNRPRRTRCHECHFREKSISCGACLVWRAWGAGITKIETVVLFPTNLGVGVRIEHDLCVAVTNPLFS